MPRPQLCCTPEEKIAANHAKRCQSYKKSVLLPIFIFWLKPLLLRLRCLSVLAVIANGNQYTLSQMAIIQRHTFRKWLKAELKVKEDSCELPHLELCSENYKKGNVLPSKQLKAGVIA